MSKIFNNDTVSPDAYWFLHSIEEIFIDEVYKFECHKDSPRIIDCGSNIGLSIIYFKRRFPHAEVIGFEPDPELLNYAQQNIDNFCMKDNVTLINKAVWKYNGTIPFYIEGTLGGAIVENAIPKDNVIEVPCIDISTLLKNRVDFLKIDIEGAELEVLDHCKNNLHVVENMFVEFHGFKNKQQTLNQLLEIISSAGFRYYIKESYPNLRFPFIEKVPRNNSYDVLLNIFCYRV
ncbi:MAG: FkbM family methyltransferase [Lewinellaceae bacterium]|nr:FkbM family methyltransferase [Lewinellaceae bacterium]